MQRTTITQAKDSVLLTSPDGHTQYKQPAEGKTQNRRAAASFQYITSVICYPVSVSPRMELFSSECLVWCYVLILGEKNADNKLMFTVAAN